MKFSGKGDKASQLAAWFNTLLSGALIKYVRAGRGVQIQSSGERTITISTLAAVNQLFKLTAGKHQMTSGFVAGKLVAPGAAPAGGAIDQRLIFTYAPGWYAENQVVVAQNIGGQWEVVSPAAESHFKGTLSGALTEGGDTDVVISGTYGGTVSAKNIYNLTGDNGDVVGVEWEPNLQRFVVTAIICPSAVPEE